MANQKVYTIQINGITESVNLTDELIKKLNQLDKVIDNLTSKKINVQVDTKAIEELQKSLTKVTPKSSTSGSSSDNTAKTARNVKNLTDAEKEQLAIEKALAAETNRVIKVKAQYNEQVQEAARQAKDEIANLAKQNTATKTYANTMNGLKEQLKDLNAQKGNIVIDSTEFEEISKKINDVNQALKDTEAKQGIFSRNVGDYYNQMKKALEDTNKQIAQTGTTINSLNEKKTILQGLVNSTKTGTEEWNNYNNELKQVKAELDSLTKGMQSLGRAEDQLNTKLQVTIDGFGQLTFDDVGQAINVLEDKMYALAAAGETNTQTYKDLQSQIVRLRKNMKNVDESVDSLVQKNRGLTLLTSGAQAFVSAFQVGTGVMQLFGASEEEATKQMARMTNLIGILTGLQELSTQAITKGTAVNKIWEASLKGVDLLFGKVTTAEKANTLAVQQNTIANNSNAGAINTVDKATKTATTSMNLFKGALASLGIGLIVLAVSELVNALFKLGDTSDKIKKSTDNVITSISGFGEATRRANQDIERLRFNGIIGAADEAREKLKILENEFFNVAKSISQTAGLLIREGYIKIATPFVSENFDNETAEEIFLKSRKMVLDAVKELKMYNDQILDIKQNREDTFLTGAAYNKDARNIRKLSENMKENTERIKYYIASTLASFQDFDKQLIYFGDDTKINLFVDSLKQIDTILLELQKSGFNLEEFFKPEEYNKIVQEFTKYYNKLVDLRMEKEKVMTEISRKAQQDYIDTMEESFAKERLLVEKAREDELAAISSTGDEDKLRKLKYSEKEIEIILDARNAVIKKYNTQLADIDKRFMLQVRADNRTILQNQLDDMRNSLDKRLTLLELERQAELDSVSTSTTNRGRLEASVNEKYDKQILKIKQEYFREREKQLKDYYDNYMSIVRDNEQRIIDIQTSDIEQDRANQSVSSNFEFDPSLTGEALFNEQKKWLDKQLNQTIEYNKQMLEQTKKSRALQYESERETIIRGGEQQLQAIRESYEQGIIEKEDYEDQNIAITKAYNEQVNTLTKQYHADLTNLDKQYYVDWKETVASSTNEVLNIYKEFAAEIDAMHVDQKDRVTGIITPNDVKQQRQVFMEQLQMYQNLSGQIQQEHANLQAKLDSNQISFNDFTVATKELKDLQKTINANAKEITKQSENLTRQSLQSITAYITQILGNITSIWSTFSDIQNMKLEQEQARLDEENEMLQNALDKQESIVEQHNSKINSMEDELKNARGDRRQFLLDGIAAETQAQIAAMQEEQRLKNQQKQIEEREKALEKKRLEQDKKQKIVQATINTATAVMNALAVQPWFVGVALSAVAAAMGAVQISTIKNAKYAKGGLLTGPSHSQGGIQVGNTGIEVEGNEYIVNKKSTKENLPILEYINKQNRAVTLEELAVALNGKKQVVKMPKTTYADGGLLPDLDIKNLIQTGTQDDRPIVVQVVDIVNAQDNLRQVQTIAGLA